MSKRSKQQSQLSSFFSIQSNSNPKKRRTNASTNVNVNVNTNNISNELAEFLASKLRVDSDSTRIFACKPQYITNDGKSWIIHMKQWMPSISLPTTSFQEEWDLHPKAPRNKIKIFNKLLEEKRWSQSWGKSINYSSIVHSARNIQESTIVPLLLDNINGMMQNFHNNIGNGHDRSDRCKFMYNAVLQNWYEVEDSMGLHADDESYLHPRAPIFSLSWGGTRRFLLRKKATANGSDSQKDKGSDKIEWLEDGDLLVMCGTTQETHKHEVPKVRVKDPLTSRRINWTVRAVK